MFKKSEEQEWTRFRGALSNKEREETAAVPTPETGDVTTGTTSGPPLVGQNTPPPASPGPSFRASTNDVNVGLPTTRMSRSNGVDGMDIETLIGERSTFEGTLKTEGPVRLLGAIQGEIESKSAIIVEEKAHVTARLTAQQVTVAGQVDGQIYCEGRVEIRPTGRVTGEINAGALIVQEGAFFDGNSRMATGGNATATSSAKSAS